MSLWKPKVLRNTNELKLCPNAARLLSTVRCKTALSCGRAVQPCDLLNIKNACAPQQRLSANRLLCCAQHTVAMPIAAPSHTAVSAVLTVTVTARIIRPKGDRHRVLGGSMMMIMMVMVMMWQAIWCDSYRADGTEWGTELQPNDTIRGTGWECGTGGAGREASHAERVIMVKYPVRASQRTQFADVRNSSQRYSWQPPRVFITKPHLFSLTQLWLVVIQLEVCCMFRPVFSDCKTGPHKSLLHLPLLSFLLPCLRVASVQAETVACV